MEKIAEWIEDSSGAYSFAHYYYHPTCRRRVVLIGMWHFAEVTFYDLVKEILAPCDLVLYEDITPKRFEWTTKEEKMEWVRQNIFCDSLDDAFVSVVRHGKNALFYLLGFSHAGQAFRYEYLQPHWINVDLLANDIIDRRAIDLMVEQLVLIPSSVKHDVVEYYRSVFRRMERGEFTKRDLLEFSFPFSSFSTHIEQIYSERLLGVARRDSYCFSEFDRLCGERSPAFVGIKFGASHMTFQRSMLEARGYVHERSIKLRANKF